MAELNAFWCFFPPKTVSLEDRGNLGLKYHKSTEIQFQLYPNHFMPTNAGSGAGGSDKHSVFKPRWIPLKIR